MVEPSVKLGERLAANDGLELGEDVARLRQCRDAPFDCRYRDHLRLGELIAAACEQACDRSSGRRAADRASVHLFRSLAPPAPFTHDTLAASKPAFSQSSPLRQAISGAGGPLCVQPRQIRFKRTGARAENVGTLTAEGFADQSSAVTRPTDDLSYRHSLVRQRQDGGVGLPAALDALVLQPLFMGQQSRIYPGGSDRVPDLAHAFADSVEERPTGVLHQMPAVGDLNGVRESPLGRHGITAAAISGDHANLRLARQPRFCARRLSIRQQRDRSVTLQVAEERAVAMVPLPSPVVDVDYRRGVNSAAPRRRTIRSSVLLLTQTLSRCDNAAAGRPPDAIARQ